MWEDVSKQTSADIVARETGTNELVPELTDPKTPLKKRMLLAQVLFPASKKEKILATASKDAHGRPVRYFRRMTLEQLRALLQSQRQFVTESQYLDKLFSTPRRVKGKTHLVS